MPKFTNLNDIQKYIESQAKSIISNSNAEKVLAEKMSQAVKDVVYARYLPKQYKRAGDNGGLSDVRNMKFTKVEVTNGKITILFENLRQGQTHFIPIYGRDIDSLHGNYITDTIEEGLGNNWYTQGEWSKARPFVAETVKRIRANPQPLIDAIKVGFRNAGFQVK